MRIADEQVQDCAAQQACRKDELGHRVVVGTVADDGRGQQADSSEAEDDPNRKSKSASNTGPQNQPIPAPSGKQAERDEHRQPQSFAPWPIEPLRSGE